MENNKIRTHAFFLNGIFFTSCMKAKIKYAYVTQIPVHFYCSLYIPLACSGCARNHKTCVFQRNKFSFVGCITKC